MGRLTRRAHATAAKAKANARTLTLLGCVASNTIGAALVDLAYGFFAFGIQGLTLLALEMKGTARGAR